MPEPTERMDPEILAVFFKSTREFLEELRATRQPGRIAKLLQDYQSACRSVGCTALATVADPALAAVTAATERNARVTSTVLEFTQTLIAQMRAMAAAEEMGFDAAPVDLSRPLAPGKPWWRIW